MIFTVDRFPEWIRATQSSDQNCITRKVILAAMPFDLTVTGEMRGGYQSPCQCKLIYRATAESVEWLRRNEMLKRGISEVCVCSCMGRIRSESSIAA